MGILISGTKREGKKDKFSPSSSFIELVEFDEKAKTMDITFRTGTKVRYIGVYPTTYLTFKQSPVHSAFYARAIKGNIQSVKIASSDIGTNSSAPLKKVTRSQTLDTGIKQQQSRANRKYGTVERAFNAAIVGEEAND